MAVKAEEVGVAKARLDKMSLLTPAVLAGAFIAFGDAGSEHSVANMYFLPAGLLIKWFSDDEQWRSLGASAADYPERTIVGMAYTLVPVTIGNVIGGGVLVGIVYWFVCLRKR